MNKYKRLFTLCLSAFLLLTGCDNPMVSTESTEEPVILDTATREIRQNDFRGGVIRTVTLQNSVLKIMEGMKRNNIVVREDNPNSFWTTSGYQDFVSTFLNCKLINDTQWFNEEETDWVTLVNKMLSVPNSFTYQNDDGSYSAAIDSSCVIRNEKDDYSITGTSDTVGDLGGKATYRILYDCDKDWCKAYTTVEINGSGVNNVTSQLFEYARISNNVFAIQTSKERLLVVLDAVETDTDLRSRTIKEFYYSRLSGGQRTTFTPYEPLPEEDEDGTPLFDNQRLNALRAQYSMLNEFGEIATQYGVKNSIFTQENVSETSYPWVFEDGALQQAIVYKQNTLVVTTYNKLSEKYERFIYSTNKVDEKLISEIEDMVKIEGLVGVVEVKKSDIETVPAKPEDETPTPVQSSSVATTSAETSNADDPSETTAATETTATTSSTAETLPENTISLSDNETPSEASNSQNTSLETGGEA